MPALSSKNAERLRQAQNSFSDARDKLVKNRGNVIRQAEMLKQLEVKPTKTMPAKIADLAGEEERDLPMIEAKVEMN